VAQALPDEDFMDLVERPAPRLAPRTQWAQDTFLIADIRGYSTFTRERGDETAARLAMRFADLARDAHAAFVTQDALTYYENRHSGLSVIAVGGDKLSRGLTLEGLTVSYYLRASKTYDTLLQMGRWFGYRPGFEDLCRVHLSRDSINWYSHIAEAAEELTQQVKRMRRDGLSPIDFGLYVRSHPDSLLITAANKMRSGQEVTVEQTFSGRLRETYIVSTDSDVNARNFDLIAEHWRGGFGGRPEEVTEKGVIFRDIPIAVVEDSGVGAGGEHRPAADLLRLPAGQLPSHAVPRSGRVPDGGGRGGGQHSRC
jgi:hypothetical protein